jgi:hypothetical protein
MKAWQQEGKGSTSSSRAARPLRYAVQWGSRFKALRKAVRALLLRWASNGIAMAAAAAAPRSAAAAAAAACCGRVRALAVRQRPDRAMRGLSEARPIRAAIPIRPIPEARSRLR